MNLRVHVVCKLCVTANGSYSSAAMSLFVVAPIVCVAFVSGPDFSILFIASILGLQPSRQRQKRWRVAVIVPRLFFAMPFICL